MVTKGNARGAPPPPVTAVRLVVDTNPPAARLDADERARGP